jgi:hypothetical protein
MGGSTKQTTKSTQTTSLPEAQQGNVNLLMSGAKDLYNSGGPQYFSGKNYTTPTANQVAGRQSVVDFAQGAGQQQVNNATAANDFWLNPQNVYNLSNVPGYSGMRQGIVDTVGQQLTEQWMPQNRGTAISGGQLGGSRQMQMDALAMGRSSEGLGRALADLDFQTAGRNMQMADSAMGRAPAMFQLGLQPGSTVSQVGTAERADDAERLAADMARWDFDQNKQGKLLALLQALTGSAGQYGGTTTGKQTTKQTSDQTGQLLGAALTAASMFFPPAGAAAAAAGAAGGLTAGQIAGTSLLPAFANSAFGKI